MGIIFHNSVGMANIFIAGELSTPLFPIGFIIIISVGMIMQQYIFPIAVWENLHTDPCSVECGGGQPLSAQCMVGVSEWDNYIAVLLKVLKKVKRLSFIQL